jgi:hypothetical protein
MRKFIYRSIVEQLKKLKDEQEENMIKHFDLWNNNVLYIEQEQPFYMPAVLVAFEPITWRMLGKRNRETEVRIILHILTQHNAPSSEELGDSEMSLQFFDLLNDVNRILHAHHKIDGGFIHDALTCVQSTTDHDFEGIRHDMEIYSCHGIMEITNYELRITNYE